MLKKNFFRHQMKAKYVAQSLNEQLNSSNKRSDLKIVAKKEKGKEDRWFLTLQ